MNTADIRLSELGLSINAQNVCISAQLVSLFAIADYADIAPFRLLRNCGPKTERELESLLIKHADRINSRFGQNTPHYSPDFMPRLTKREYFAGLAMQSIINHQAFKDIDENDIGIVSIEYADALISALNPNPSELEDWAKEGGEG